MKEALREGMEEPVRKDNVEDPDGEGLTRFYSKACYSCGEKKTFFTVLHQGKKRETRILPDRRSGI